MSMTQVAFLKRADIPTNKEIQDSIRLLGYDFTILSDLNKQFDQDGLECTINGRKTYFETYVGHATEVSSEADWIKPDLTNQDAAISFVWGADYAAGACIGLISVALIDRSKALIYYMDDQMKYSREALLADTPQFLSELERQNKRVQTHQQSSGSGTSGSHTKKSFLDKLKNMFK